jgi:hypothetical protein
MFATKNPGEVAASSATPEKRSAPGPSFPTLQDFLVAEDDPSILDFRCSVTGIPLWTQIRSEFMGLMLSDLFYASAFEGKAKGSVPKTRALTTLSRSMLNNLWFQSSGRCQADVCLVATAAGNQWLDGKWFNRLSDHFALACPTRTVAIESHFEWKWPLPRHNERVMYHAPQQAANSIAGRVLVREGHRRQARELLSLVLGRAKRSLGWSPDAAREQVLSERLSRKVAALPRQYRSYEALLQRIRPKVLIVEEACYGVTAALIAAARRLGIVTAEYQHGGISAGHYAYNFASTICASPEFREALPEHFLGYGEWWNDQISAPVAKIAMGNPHRDAKLAQMPREAQRKQDILILSDGVEFLLYLDLARQIASQFKSQDLRVVLRPHPLERSQILARHGKRIDEILLDDNDDLYTSLASAYVVISEVSTGLFDAAGLADRVFIWDTPKSRFAYDRHPFQRFSSAASLLDLLKDDEAGRVAMADVHAIWAPDWQKNYLDFLERQGVSFR